MKSSLARAGMDSFAISFCAFVAASMAFWTSASVPLGTEPIRLPSPGDQTSKRSPLSDSTHSPPMNIL